MFAFNQPFRIRRRGLRASVLSAVIATMVLSLGAAHGRASRQVWVPDDPRTTGADAVRELYDAVNGGRENDVIRLRAGQFVLDADLDRDAKSVNRLSNGRLLLKPGMVLQGANEWATSRPKSRPPSGVQPGTETVIDGTNLLLAFPLTPADGAEGVIEVTPGNRLANLTVRGDNVLSSSAGGSAVVLMRPAPQDATAERVVIEDVVIDGGSQGFMALHRFDDDDRAHSVVEIDHSIIKNARLNGVMALLWQGVSESSFHITINRCRLEGSRFGVGVFTSSGGAYTGVGDNHNDVVIFSSHSLYHANGDVGAIFLPRLGANDNRFRFISQNDEFAGNGEAVRAFGSGFATMEAPSNDNHVILLLLSNRFNRDTIVLRGTREPEPYPGTGNRVDLFIRQGKSDLPSESDFLLIENATSSNSVQLLGGHIQVEFGP